jgi:hypothetical protein
VQTVSWDLRFDHAHPVHAARTDAWGAYPYTGKADPDAGNPDFRGSP